MKTNDTSKNTSELTNFKNKADSKGSYKFCFFGDRMINAMNIRGVTCRELSERLFISPSAITGYRVGRRSPNVADLVAIATALNVSLGYLLGLKATPDKLYSDEVVS